MTETFVDALARMAVQVGANIQPGQVVVVDSDVGKEAITEAVTTAAYEVGARYVDVVVNDRRLARARAVSAQADTLSYVPPWIAERYTQLAELGGGWIRLAGPAQGDVLADIEPAKTMLVAPPVAPGVVEVVNASATNWTVVPAPTQNWASLVHPDLDGAAALARLWQEIARACRLDVADTVAAWSERLAELQRVSGWLSDGGWDAIRMVGPGTDLTVGLMATSRWTTAGQRTSSGIEHRANLPSEEVFTAPDPTRVDGTVSTTKPVLVSGVTVEDLRLTFENGAVVAHAARRGGEVIDEILERDDGARRLGELALVDGSGRVGALETIFHETLLDENAASHIALGSAYPFCVESSEDRGRINQSSVHVDLMIGSERLEIDGVTADGSRTALMRAGAWQNLPR